MMAKEVRNNDRVMLDDVELAERLWKKLQPFCPPYVMFHPVVGLNERVRFYRYEKGQRFRWHMDGSYRRQNGEHSRLTFMVYLNDGFEGGETLFQDTTVEPERGMALVFAHGYLHEGGEVFAGRKYVLRTDIMFAAEPVEVD